MNKFRETMMNIITANIEDSEQILSLQKLAYQSEAEIYQDSSIPPLTQTNEEIKKNFRVQTFLKASNENGDIIGSVRAYVANKTCHIGRVIVHPEWQGKGTGTELMNAIEEYFSDAKRYELFTGAKSTGNIRFYRRLGYKPFKEKAVHESLSLIYFEKSGRTSTQNQA